MGQAISELRARTMYPEMKHATSLEPGARSVLVGAYGFEERALGWVNARITDHTKLHGALMFRSRIRKEEIALARFVRHFIISALDLHVR